MKTHTRFARKGIGMIGVVVALTLSNALPASAASGNYTGYEDAPATMNLITPPLTLCAEYLPSMASPLVETINDLPGPGGTSAGSITFTNSSTNYDANPVGTWPHDTNFLTACNPALGALPFAVPGSLAISLGGVTCSGGTGTFLRTNGSQIAINGTCTSGLTTYTVTSTGIELACIDPLNPCPAGFGHQAILAGTYSLT